MKQVHAKEKKVSSERLKLLRRLPQIHAFLEHPDVQRISEKHPRFWVKEILQERVEILRKKILKGEFLASDADFFEQKLLLSLEDAVAERLRGDLRRVINATGISLHTNLGRSPLSERAIEKINSVSKGYCNVEYDIKKGRRGGRMSGIIASLKRLTGAESALIVNNNAAATMLMLQVMASDREVILSRGELVEIGGSFRMPDVMVAAGVHLHEVGTTNRTHLWDYEDAINESTGLLLKVHQSNYVIQGFTKEVSTVELVSLGKKRNVPVAVDLGSGSIFPMTGVFQGELTVGEVVETGAEMVCFSGDKLLGGPQAGILVGKKEWIDKASKAPITRALRVDKLTLAALEATLQLYLEGSKTVRKHIPVQYFLHRKVEELREVGKRLLKQMVELSYDCSIEESISAVGGGAYPGVQLPTIRLLFSHPRKKAKDIEKALRFGHPSVISMLERGKVVFDLRTVRFSEEQEILDRLCEIVKP